MPRVHVPTSPEGSRDDAERRDGPYVPSSPRLAALQDTVTPLSGRDTRPVPLRPHDRLRTSLGRDRVVGGHAVVAIGYDDGVGNALCDVPTEGALLVRNSWGEEWGEGGYGWLPYAYVLGGLAVDWWTLLKSEWVDLDAFEPES